MFGHKSKPCKVFKYGCLAPTTSLSEIKDEMYRRNKYWNNLVAIDRVARQNTRLFRRHILHG